MTMNAKTKALLDAYNAAQRAAAAATDAYIAGNDAYIAAQRVVDDVAAHRAAADRDARDAWVAYKAARDAANDGQP